MGAMTTVLVVDDEPIVRDVVVRYLRREGFETIEAGDGGTAKKLISTRSPELVVLDLMLPGTDGLSLCRWIRSRGNLPVIMLTARGETADRIVGLEVGADDYVAKPFSARELVMRVKAVLRRVEPEDAALDRLVFDGLELDPRSRDVIRDGEELRLTAKEFDLLYFLAAHPRQVFSRSQLMASVWGYEAVLDTGTLAVHVRRLRAKIERDPAHPAHLETVWGVGYRFVP
jgi:DNA-binding response OmpR family regulator